MRAVYIEKHVPPSEIMVADVPIPAVPPGHLLVRVRAAGVNPSDVRYAGGIVPDTLLPRIPGRDFAGVVEQGPPEVVGKEVYGTGGDLGISRDGAHAEYLAVPPGAVSIKPSNLTFSQAAAVGVPFVTAYKAIVELAAAQSGETVFILGASGAVGTAAAQLAKWIGARVIGTTLRDDKAVLWRNYTDVVATLPDDNAVEVVKRATGDKGANVVFNAAGGGAVFEAGFESLAYEGRMVCITAAGERRVCFDLMTFYKRVMRWFGLDTLELTASDCAPVLDHLRGGFESGTFKTDVAREIPLERAAEAYELVSKGGIGKVVLTMGG